MAPLTAAQAARIDAALLRGHARELKLIARGNLANSRERMGNAQRETDRARAWRVEPLPSAWSDLRWMQSFDTLEQTLVLLP